MSQLIKPEGYKAVLGKRQTEQGIKLILIWYPILERSIELSSMGVRVDKTALLRQLSIEKQEERQQLFFHQQLLSDKLPLCIGGGIGQSRLCMIMLHKAHIGEIQASIWAEEMRRECEEAGMPLI